MAKNNHNPSIENEPHLQRSVHETDPTEKTAEQVLASEARNPKIDDAVEHTVWDEPALSAELTGDGSDGRRLTYAEWLDWRMATTPAARTWIVTLLVVLAAGPWGILGALFKGPSGMWGFVTVTIAAPVTEEIMKIAAALWVVEKRPYLFRMPFQILLCTLAGGLAFAFIENLMYLSAYAPHAGAESSEVPGIANPQNFALWRWTVCTGLHATCSFFAGLGLVRMWSYAVTHRTRPQISHAAPLIIAAMIGHGLYNGVVTIAELGGWLKF